MKTSVIKVGDMLSVWSLDEVESRIGEVPGVESVTVNFAAESATVRYDETRVAVAEIKSTVHELGLQRAKPADDVPVAKDAPTENHQGHIDESEPDAAVLATKPKSKTDVPAATHDPHAGHDRHDDKVSDASKPSADKHADKPKQPSGHEGHENHDKHQGHSPAMFRDRFWLSLAVTVPVVIWSAHIQDLLGYQAPAFPGSDWMPAVLSTAVLL
jgi:Cu2+-exporting ATPase